MLYGRTDKIDRQFSGAAYGSFPRPEKSPDKEKEKESLGVLIEALQANESDPIGGGGFGHMR